MAQDRMDRRQWQRIVELRGDLGHKKPERVAYARQTLATMLWLEDERARQLVTSVLCGYLPDEIQAIPEFAARLSRRLAAHAGTDDLMPTDANTIASELGKTVAEIVRIALQRLRVIIDDAGTPDVEGLYLETDVCRDGLILSTCFGFPSAVDSSVQILRLFPPDMARDAGPLARQTGPLREAASHLLGALSADALYPYWYALGSPDRIARRDLLPVLDYINDVQATPYLVRLFERRGQWSDGEMVGWFAVRAFKRIRDRRALPALRRVVSVESSQMLAGTAGRTSPDLLREVKRAIEAIEYGRSSTARDELLRASHAPSHELLHPSEPPTMNLLRPSQQPEEDLIRPADPQAHELLRGSRAPMDSLLRAAEQLTSAARDHAQLLRGDVEPANPFENFDPLAGF